MASQITWDSIPKLDDWGWGDFWSCDDLIEWSKALRDHYGNDQGDSIWVDTFDKSTYGSAWINCSTHNDAFRKYVTEDTDLASRSTILSKVYKAEGSVNSVLKPVQDVYSGIGNVLSGVGNLLSGAGKSINIFGKIVPVMTILISLMLTAGIGLLIYGLSRNPGQAIGTAIKYAK